jgi:glycosyltransferase involved in cell wall biosynthesis
MNTYLPKVSIITPSYNQGAFIGATIESVLAQTYPNIEYILIDGGSTDETMAVVEQYRHRIDIVVHERDRGQSDAINKGFRLATGDLVGWINSDDLLYADCVERIVKLYHKHPDGTIFYGGHSDWIDTDGRVTGYRHLPIPDRTFLLTQCVDIVQQGSFYATQHVRAVGYLDETIHYCMDLDLWLRLLTKGPIYQDEGPAMAAFRRWEATKTSTGGRHFQHDIRRVLRRHGASLLARTVLRTWYGALRESIKSSVPFH